MFIIDDGQNEQNTRSDENSPNNERIRKTKYENGHDR
jgi:hypothetical protein